MSHALPSADPKEDELPEGELDMELGDEVIVTDDLGVEDVVEEKFVDDIDLMEKNDPAPQPGGWSKCGKVAGESGCWKTKTVQQGNSVMTQQMGCQCPANVEPAACKDAPPPHFAGKCLKLKGKYGCTHPIVKQWCCATCSKPAPPKPAPKPGCKDKPPPHFAGKCLKLKGKYGCKHPVVKQWCCATCNKPAPPKPAPKPGCKDKPPPHFAGKCEKLKGK